MSDGSEKYRDEALGDVTLLRLSSPSRQLLADSRNLTRLVLYRLGVGGDISGYCRAEVLSWLLPRIVDDVRERALNSPVLGVRRRGELVFQAAAATELLKIRTPRFDEQYDRLKKELRKLSLGVSPAGNPGSVVAAAAWLGFTKGAIADEEKKVELYLAFLQELEGYLLRPKVRDEVRAMIEQYAQAALNSKSPSVPTLQVGAVAEVKYSRPLTPEIRDILIDLADQVKEKLREERAANRLGRAAALPLPRQLIRDEQYVDDPRNVMEAWGVDSSDRRWESARVKDLVELVVTASCARLVVLGQGGAGKTTLAALMALEILESADRPEGSPIPVIFSLSSWSPRKQPNLSDWIVKRLITEHRALKQTDRAKESQARRLVGGGYIMPILDGFDEIDTLVQSAALRAINSWAERGNSVVLLSRGPEYLHAVAVSRPLVKAAVVEMQNAELSDVEEYLGRTTNRSAEWDDVFEQVGGHPESDRSVLLHSVLTTPLMAMLAGAVYDSADCDESEVRRSPIELLDTERFSSAHALTEYLLDAFIRVRLDPRFTADDGRRGRTWHPDDERKWLGFLAAALVVDEAREFRWWKPGGVFDAGLEKIGTFVGLGALVGGIVAYVSTDSLREALHHLGSLFVGLFGFSIIIWFIASQEAPRTLAWRFGSKRKDQWGASPSYEQFVTSLLVPLFLPLMVGGIARSVVAAVVTLAIVAVVYYSSPIALVERESPTALLHDDRIVAVLRAGWFPIPIVTWLFVAWLVTGQINYLVSVPMFAFFFGLVSLFSASTLWTLRTWSLAVSGRLPWGTMRFLEYAHKRGILRQSGGVYQFRHAALQEYLAQEQIYSLPGKWVYESSDHMQGKLIMSRFRSGVYDQADADLREMIAADLASGQPGRADSKRLLLVQVAREKGNLKEAVEQLRKYKESNSRVRRGPDLENQLLLVELLAELGDDALVRVESEKLFRDIEKQNHWYKGPARDEAKAIIIRLWEHPLFKIHDES